MALRINDRIWVNGLRARLGDALKGFHLLPALRLREAKYEPVPCVEPCIWCEIGHPRSPLGDG